MSKFTEGPWELEVQEGIVADTVWVVHANLSGGVKSWAIANMPREEGDEELEANARLISAAPDMLEALKRIVSDWDGEPEDMAEAIKAITKAEGRTP